MYQSSYNKNTSNIYTEMREQTNSYENDMRYLHQLEKKFLINKIIVGYCLIQFLLPLYQYLVGGGNVKGISLNYIIYCIVFAGIVTFLTRRNYRKLKNFRAYIRSRECGEDIE